MIIYIYICIIKILYNNVYKYIHDIYIFLYARI